MPSFKFWRTHSDSGDLQAASPAGPSRREIPLWVRTWFLSCSSGAVLVVAALPVAAQSGWRAEWGLTLPYNLPMPLRITQSGEPDLDFTARYASEPFAEPVTWQLRVGRWNEGHAWELELVHHKVYLENGPPEIEKFSISHGFNLLTLQRAWRREHYEWRLGTGVVLAHPESVVRSKTLAESGESFGGGYHVAGPTVSIAAARPVSLTHGTFLDLEGKLAMSYASVPVVNGRAHVYSIFLHLAFLLGYGAAGGAE